MRSQAELLLMKGRTRKPPSRLEDLESAVCGSPRSKRGKRKSKKALLAIIGPKPKKPLSAFIFYSQDVREKIKKE